jgi:hypothetical protein
MLNKDIILGGDLCVKGNGYCTNNKNCLMCKNNGYILYGDTKTRPYSLKDKQKDKSNW